jgi:O-antigen/teichoic acid export membrane protein
MEPVPLATAPYGRLIGMSAAFATSNFARMAISFATSLVVGRALGVDDFGRWTLCIAWASLLTSVADFGFGILLTREAAANDPGTGRAVAVALVVRVGALLPVALLFVLMPSLLASDTTTAEGFRIVPPIAIAGAAYGCLAAVFRAWPRTLAAALGIETAGALGQWAISWWLVGSGYRVIALLVVAASVQGVQLVAAIVLWFRIASPRTLLEWPSPAIIRRTLREAWPFAAAGIIANVQGRLAPVLLGFLASPAALAAFGAASRIGGLARILPQAAFAGALPVLSYEARLGTSESVRARFDRTLLAFAVAAASAIALLAAPLVSWTYGKGFAAAVAPLVWTGIGLIPTLVNSGRKVYLYASGLERAAVKWGGVALALQAAACASLIPAFGASGAAVALAFGEAAVSWPLYKVTVKAGELGSSPVGVVSDSPLPG